MRPSLVFLFLFFGVEVARGAVDLPRRWEAETGLLAGRAQVIDVSTASEARAVRVGMRGRVEWRMTAATSGRYELNLRYRTGDQATFPRLQVAGRVRGVGLTASFDEWTETALVVSLPAGEFTLVLEGTAREFDLDLLHFTALPRTRPAPLAELPTVAPRQAFVSLAAPRSLTFLVRRNGQGEPAVRLNGRDVAVQWAAYEEVEDAAWMTVPAVDWGRLKSGGHALSLDFPAGAEVRVPVTVEKRAGPAPLMIATLDVGHGKATLLRMPDGKVVLIDCGKPEAARDRLVPFLQAHGVSRIDHVFITHYHEDHAGGREILSASVSVGAVHDYRGRRAGDRFELGGVEWFVLNAHGSGIDENSRSLSLQLRYQDFVYTDGADTYGWNQMNMLDQFPDRIRSHVVYGNHHFHGSVDVHYLRRTDPVLFLVSADAAVYARAAFTDHFRRDVEGYLKSHDSRLRETLLTAEVGHILLRVFDAERWTYETARPGEVFAAFRSER